MTYYILPTPREKRIIVLSKKIGQTFILICSLFLITGCKSESISMVVPSGGPQFSTLYMQDDKNYDVTIVEGADPLVAAFGSESYDVIIAPTNLGAKLYDSKPTYQLAASVTWGNFYLVSTTEILLDDLKQRDIIAFGKNQTPDVIMSYVLGNHEKTTYLDSLSSVVASFILDHSKVYLISEPALSILDENYDLNIIDLQDAYQSLTGKSSYPQASVFVHKDLTDKVVQKIKKDLEKSIDYLNNQPEQAADLAIKLGIDVKKNVIISSISRFHINYVSAIDAQSDIVFYLELLKAFNPKFIGENLPDQSFYR